MKVLQTLSISTAFLLSIAAWGQQTTQQPPKQNPATASAKSPEPCSSEPVKKPRFHIPARVQKAINKQAVKIYDTTGVEVDPKTPEQVIRDAQAQKPCAPAPAGKAPPAPVNPPPAKQ